MHIRPVKVDELDRVHELELLCFKDPYPKEFLYMLLSLYPELFLVAELGNEVVGYVVGVVRTDRTGHIVSLCVHPTHRERGLGAELVKAIEKVFREKFGICRYRLEVRVSNLRAISLYKKLGYVISDIVNSYYPDGEDAYAMTKDECT